MKRECERRREKIRFWGFHREKIMEKIMGGRESEEEISTVASHKFMKGERENLERC